MDRRFLLMTGFASVAVFAATWSLAGPAQPHRAASAAEGSVYYARCAEAWAAGVAPIYRGQPGYRPGLDGDDDGIACEPYRGHDSDRPHFGRWRFRR